MRTTLLSSALLALFAVGCADQVTTADDRTGGGGGGKADEGSSSRQPVEELDEEQQSYLRAADAECLHVGRTNDDTYLQGVKLFCLPRGGTGAPIALYLAVTPIGEADGAYKVYQLPEYAADVPQNVEFSFENNRATFNFDVKQIDWEAEDFAFVTHSATTTVDFSGPSENPTVTAAYTLR